MAKSYLKIIADELDYNEALQQKYPLACKHGDVWNADRIETASGVCVEALGKGNPVRGRKFKHYRPTLIVLDDPQGDDDIASPSTRAKDIAWLNKGLLPVGDTVTNFFVIGTNLHRECIVNTVAARPDFKCMKYASIVSWPTNMGLWDEWERIYLAKMDEDGKIARAFYDNNRGMMDEGAVVLWPVKESLYDLMCIRAASGHPAFDSERQNNPRDPNKCEFREEWFEGDDVYYDTLPAVFKNGVVKVGFGDPAKGGETKRHDYSALIILHYDVAQGRCYVECDITRCPVNVFIDKMIRAHVVHRLTVIGCEANGFQSLVGDEAIAKCPLLPLQPVEHYNIHKNTRISRLAIWLQRKFFIFKRGCPHTKILLQQLLDHPNSDHDDGSDALEACLRLLTDHVDLGVATLDVEYNEDDGIGDNVFDDNPYIGGLV